MKDFIFTIIAFAAVIFCGVQLIGSDTPTYFNYLYLGGMIVTPLIFSDNILNVLKKWAK